MKAVFAYIEKPGPGTPDRLQGILLMNGILKELGVERSCTKEIGLASCGENLERLKDEARDGPIAVVTMGAKPLKEVAGNDCSFTTVRGEPIPVPADLGLPEGSVVYATFDPLQVWGNPGVEDLFRRDLRHLAAIMKGKPEQDPHVDNLVLHTPDSVRAFANSVEAIWAESGVPLHDRFLVVDCEWHGRNWLEPDRYIRTVQVGYMEGKAVTIELYREHPDFDDDAKWPKKTGKTAQARKDMVADRLAHPVAMVKDMDGMWNAVRYLLEEKGFPIMGHNVIADWQWLLSFGVDIRDNVFYDTMLAEHLINSDGPFRLDEVAMRRTPYGRYNIGVDLWVDRHKDFCREGYGAVPHELLEPYGGADVDCPRLIYRAQIRILSKYGMLDERGPSGEYPSLLDSTLLNELATDELERNGLPIDRTRLSELIDAYQKMRAQLLSEITLMAMAVGMTDFNPNSQNQMRELLFGKLGLTPVKTTGGQSWGDAVGMYGIDADDAPASSTDKSVLEMLQNEHPLVKKLLQFRRIDQTCKTWLRHPDKDGEGGLEPLIWADGKIHSSFLPLTSTGRYKTSSPNSGLT